MTPKIIPTALDGVVILLEAELAEAGSVSDDYLAYVAHTDGDAFIGADDYVSDVLCVLYQADAANVVELSALRVEAAAGVRVVGRQSGGDSRDGQVIAVDACRVEQHLILHHRSTTSKDGTVHLGPMAVELPGQHRRIGHVQRTFEEILSRDGVVAWDGSKILDWYLAQQRQRG